MESFEITRHPLNFETLVGTHDSERFEATVQGAAKIMSVSRPLAERDLIGKIYPICTQNFRSL